MQRTFWLAAVNGQEWIKLRKMGKLIIPRNLKENYSVQMRPSDALLIFVPDVQRFVGSLEIRKGEGRTTLSFTHNLALNMGAKLDCIKKDLEALKEGTWEKLVKNAPSKLSENDGTTILLELNISQYKAKYLDEPELLTTYYC